MEGQKQVVIYLMADDHIEVESAAADHGRFM